MKSVGAHFLDGLQRRWPGRPSPSPSGACRPRDWSYTASSRFGDTHRVRPVRRHSDVTSFSRSAPARSFAELQCDCVLSQCVRAPEAVVGGLRRGTVLALLHGPHLFSALSPAGGHDEGAQLPRGRPCTATAGSTRRTCGDASSCEMFPTILHLISFLFLPGPI